jgi:hypothetical protein
MGAIISISNINIISASVYFYNNNIKDNVNLNLDVNYKLPALYKATSPNSGADTSGASI